MRRKFARALRKWADLIDPRTSPSDVLTIRVECDSSQFVEAVADMQARLLKLAYLTSGWTAPKGGTG